MVPRMRTSPPPFDPELAKALEAIRHHAPPAIRPDMIEQVRASRAATVETRLADGMLTCSEVAVDPGDGVPSVVLSVLRRADHVAGGPGVYFVHGGGMITGNRFTGLDTVAEWVVEFDAVAVSVEYRLAPEHPFPAAHEDCYTGLLWTAGHAVELGFDPGRLLLGGTSAGGGSRRVSHSGRGTRPGRGSPGWSCCVPCSTTATSPSRVARSTASASGTGAATRPAGTPTSGLPAGAPTCRSTPLPPGRRISGTCRRPSWTSGVRRSSGTRSRHSPPASGPRAGRRNSTSGREASTASTSSPPGAELSRRARTTRTDWVRRTLRDRDGRSTR